MKIKMRLKPMKKPDLSKVITLLKKGEKITKKMKGKNLVKQKNESNTSFKLNFFGKIRTKLIGSFLILVCLIILLGTVSYLKASNALVKNYKEATLSTINKTSDYYNIMLDTVKSASLEYSLDSILKSYYSGAYEYGSKLDEQNYYKQIQNSILAASLTNKFINNITILADYGKPIATDSSLSKVDYFAFKETTEAAAVDASKNGYVWAGTHPFFDGDSVTKVEKYGLVLYRELLNRGQQSCGYLVVDFKLKELQSVLTDLNLGEGSIYAFITPDGREILGQTKTEKTGVDIVTMEGTILTDKDYYKQAMESEALSGTIDVEFENDDYLFLYSKMEETGFMVCSLVPQSIILQQANDIKLITIFLVIISTIIAILIGTVISTGIGSTIQKINGELYKVANGDLTVHIGTKRKDEFRLLTDSITHMIQNMRGLIEKATEVSKTVSGVAETLTDNSQILLDGTRGITQSIAEIEQGIVQQAEDSEHSLLEMDQLSTKINQVNHNTNEIAQVAEGTKDIVKQGIVTIDELNGKTQDTAEITIAIIDNIKDLEVTFNSINKIIDAINEIADQTNLLSLNASIEAARAGDSGRGFAVVADEIRKLADQSVKSVNDIRGIIGNINNKTEETVKTAKKAGTIVHSQQESLSKTVEMFNNIERHVAGLTNNLNQIFEGVQNISATKEGTLLAIESISSVSQETAALAEEVKETATKQLVSVEDLNKEAKELHKNSKDLEESISIFTI